LNVTLPKEKKDATYVDGLVAAAKAADYSIVLEDLHSQKCAPQFDCKNLLIADNTMEQELNLCDWCHWSTDEQSKLIVGYDSHWSRLHRDLVPESMVKNLTDKLDGGGLELEDVLPIASLTRWQADEWICETKRLHHLRELAKWHFDPAQRSIWALYNSLSTEDKAAAKTPPYLSLGRFDPSYVAGVLSTLDQNSATMIVPAGGIKKLEVPSDAERIRQLSLQLDEGSAGGGKHYYRIKIVDSRPNPDDGSPKPYIRVTLGRGDQGVTFPIYSPEREAELAKQKAAAKAAK
jgi:hypothetical protein